MHPECRHIRTNGVKCHALALRGKPWCYYHARLHTQAPRPTTIPDEPLSLPSLGDRSGIQAALGQVLDAIGSSRLSTRRAGLLLHALQIASTNAARMSAFGLPTAAHSINTTPFAPVSPPTTNH